VTAHGHAVSRFRVQFSVSEEIAQGEDSKGLKEASALGSGFKVGSDERRSGNAKGTEVSEDSGARSSRA
jgi:hypothetical protein